MHKTRVALNRVPFREKPLLKISVSLQKSAKLNILKIIILLALLNTVDPYKRAADCFGFGLYQINTEINIYTKR